MIISKTLFVTVLEILRNYPLLKAIRIRVLIKNSHNRNNKPRGQLKCDGIRAETIFRPSAKRMSPSKSAVVGISSVDVRISGSNAGYIMFRGNVKGTGYPLHSPVPHSSPPPPPPPVRHHVPSHFKCSLLCLLCVIYIYIYRV